MEEKEEIYVHKFMGARTDKETGEEQEVWVPVCTPFTCTGLLRSVDTDNGYGMRLKVRDMGTGEPQFLDIDRADLARLGAAEIRARLLRAGMQIAPGGEAVIIEVLKAHNPENIINIVSRPGWHRLGEKVTPADGLTQTFVAPGGEVIPPRKIDIELAADVSLAPEVAQAGTFANWQAAIKAAVTAGDCPHFVLGAAAGFAGVLINLTQLDTCGLAFSGPSSRGKTTAQRLAVTAWSSAALTSGGLFRSLKTTENAVEQLARLSTGTVLALDEMAHLDGQIVGRLIYALAGNTGKARMSANGLLRPSATWSSFVLLSGEKSLEQKITGDDGQWSGGMAVRFTDVDVTDVGKVPAATLDAIAAAFVNHGHAGPRFVAALGEVKDINADTLRRRILKAARKLASYDRETDSYPDLDANPELEAEPVVIRAAEPLAVVWVAGILAKEFGVLPVETDIDAAINWAWKKFGQSAEARALAPKQQMIANLRRSIAERWDVTLKNVTGSHGTREALGWYDTDTVFIPVGRISEFAGDVLKEAAIARLLDQGGYLGRRDPKRLTVHYVPQIGHVRCYALRRSMFGRP